MKHSHAIKRLEFLILLISGALYTIMAIFGRGTFWEQIDSRNLFMQLLSFPIAFLINTYHFIPKDARTKRWFVYGLKVLLLLLFLETIRVFISTKPDGGILGGAQNILIPFLIGIFLSWIFTSIRDWLIQTREIDRLQAEKIKAELAFLKTQIDPHFLFNTLNSMYATALEEDSPKTAESIIMLSTLMRYNLHDAQTDTIEIQKELDYLHKYIALQKQRLTLHTSLQSSIPGEYAHIEKLRIAPLLLIPLVENAFKYGVSQSKHTFININITLDDSKLKMDISNSIVSNAASTERTGVGLDNLRKRLELLYKGKYEFQTTIESDTFHAILNIDLQS
ncbi:MAG: histidine kinase [Saprospiraceae bacterium]|nr:histidine kinase [Saprospiraceae bacterium]